MTTTSPQRFARALTAAEALPTPRQLAARIMSSTPGADNGLRAASYEARVSGSSAAASQPEREAERRMERTQTTPLGLDDLRALNRAGTRVLDAIDALAADCLDAGTVDTWEEALHVAHLLNETVHANSCPRNRCDCRSRLEDGLAVGYSLDGWITQFVGAVHDLRAIHRRYSRRAPTRYQQSGLKADEVCEFCALLRPPVYVERQGNLRGCRHCEDIRRKAGEYQPLELLQQYHDHRSGRITQTAYRRALSDWFQSVGARPDVKGSCA